MDKLSMCRICLDEEVKIRFLINANLQELYKRLTEMPFETKDMKPVQLCYLCYARLENCGLLQATCLKSEEFFNKLIAENELKQMELNNLNILTTVHTLINRSCVPSMSEDPDNDKVDEDNDFKFDPLENTSDAQDKDDIFEDDTFINETDDIQSEGIIEDENNCTKDGNTSDNSHTMQKTELERNIHLKMVKIVLEKLDLGQLKIGAYAVKNPKLDLLNGNNKSTISTKPATEVTVVPNKNSEEKIQTIEIPVIVKNKNTVKQISFIDKHMKNNEKNMKVSSDMCSNIVPYKYNKVCEKKSAKNSNLVKNTLRHHDESPYRCEVCEKRFILRSSLVRHTRIHTGEKLFSCDMCEKTFIAKSGLVTHIRNHTGEKGHRCDICEKSFPRKSVLRNHIRMHTGEKPYKCDKCEKTFTQKSTLLKHTHKYRCDVCGKSFSMTMDYIIHIHRHMKNH